MLDLNDPAGLELFFADLPAPVDHVMVTGGGPAYGPIATETSTRGRAGCSSST